MLCDVLYYFPWLGYSISYKYPELHLPLCLHLCWVCSHTCVWGSQRHRGWSLARASNPESANIFKFWEFIFTSHGNEYTTPICLDNKSHGQSSKNRGSKFHLHTLLLKNSLYDPVWQQPLAMKKFALHMRCYESSFIFLGMATADPFFWTTKRWKTIFFQKRKTICLPNKTLSTFLYERQSLVDLFLAKGNFYLA